MWSRITPSGQPSGEQLTDSFGDLGLNEENEYSTSDDEEGLGDVPLIEDRTESSMGGIGGNDEGDVLSASLSNSSEYEDEEYEENYEEALDLSVFKTSYEIDPKDVKFGNVIGSGAYGKVYQAKLFGKEVAVKKLTTRFLDEKSLAAFGGEVDIMCSLRHPNVILFMGACRTPGNLMIITELMPRGSVSDLLRDKTKKLSFKMKMSFARDAALGMNWLHNSAPPILHLDLKSANLLVDENWKVKVADFGLSKINQTGTNRGLLGSPVYMSPEMLLHLEYDEKTDIYSYGMCLYELLTEKEPFAGEFSEIQELIDAVVKQNARPKMPACPSTRLSTLIKACWNTVPVKRPCFSEMLDGKLFDYIAIEAVVRDPKGCSLWTQNFLGRDEVSWEEFDKAFHDFFNVPRKLVGDASDSKIACIKILIADNEGEKVSIEDYARMLECYGPMEDLRFIDMLAEALQKEWFHGNLTTKEAENLLMSEKSGRYIVRFSSDPGSFTITAKSKEGIAHYRIQHKAGLKYLFGGVEYPSIDSVIKSHKKKLSLRHAVKGSKYHELFKKPLKEIASCYEYSEE